MKIEKIIKIIKEQYRISINDFKIIPRLMFRESLYFVADNGIKYMLKKYPQLIQNEELIYLIYFYSELCAHGIMTNEIVPDKNRNSFFELADGKYILFTYLEGGKCKTIDFELNYGAALKHLHDNLGTIDFSHARIS